MSRVVEAAREWIGTPYVHQATKKGAGCDCLGLLRGVWRELYGAEPQSVPAYTMDWDEPQGREVLARALARHLEPKPLADACAGDVLLFRMRKGAVAKHVGIAAEVGASPSFIHSYLGHGVVESPLTMAWAGRIAGRFAFIKGS